MLLRIKILFIYGSRCAALTSRTADISEIIWNSGRSSKIRGYSFTYDPLNRLKDASYKVKGISGWNDSENGRYDEKILEYDLNGNILKLERKGASGDGVVNGEVVKNFGEMDKLNYTYKGNQLISVKDEVDDILFRNPSSPNLTASIKGDDFSDNSDLEMQVLKLMWMALQMTMIMQIIL